ncbi:nitrate ABC transporter permease, partial [Burkholderia sp. Ac-20384]|nr:nitrate ABC transporter permease [Burkholderia sp. Ac-20384]
MRSNLKPMSMLRAVLAASLCAAASAAHAADAVRVNLAWLPQGSTGGILVAQAKG